MNKDKRIERYAFRLSERDKNYLLSKSRNTTANDGFVEIICSLRAIEAQGLAELRGFLEPREWKFLTNVLKGNERGITDRNELIHAVMQTENLAALASYHGIVPAELADKLSSLCASHVYAIGERIHDYWKQQEQVDMGEWSRY